MKIGEIIRSLRKERNMSHMEVAEACGTSQLMISAIERGERQPSLEFLGKLAKCFQVPVSFFFGEEDSGTHRSEMIVAHLDNPKELTQEKKDSLVRRVVELTENGTFNMNDWMAIYDICLRACNRKEIDLFEQDLINRIKHTNEKDVD